MTRMNALPYGFPKPPRADAALTQDMMAGYVASVRADVLTPQTPEAMIYMGETGGSFADFVHDEGFICALLGVPFRWEDGIDSAQGRVHRDACFVTEAF
jgi:hypothetical protein